MRSRLSTLAASLPVVLPLWASPAAAADMLRVDGAGGAPALLEQVGRLFTRHSGITLEASPSLGSSGGIRADSARMLDGAIPGRALSAAEVLRGLATVVTPRTPIMLVTAHRRPSAMTGHDVVQAYASEGAAWPDSFAIRPILRPRTASNGLAFVALFPGKEIALEQERGCCARSSVSQTLVRAAV